MSNDAGLSLVEILVAIILLATALIGTAGEVAAYVKQQVVEKSQVSANHLADSWFEYAESLEHATTEETGAAVATSISEITAPNPDPFTNVVNGVTYSERTTTYICPAGVILLSSCNANAGGTPGPTDTIYGQITVTWSLGGQTHTLTMTRNLADDSPYKPGDTTDPSENALLNCTRAGASPTGVISISPASGPGPSTPQPVDLDGSNHPIATGNTVNVTLTTKGLANTIDPSQLGSLGPATCVPLLWHDSNGTHQVDMHTTQANCNINSGNYTSVPCIYTASVPTSSITQTVVTPKWDAAVPFCALLSGTSGTCTSAGGTGMVEQDFVVDGPPSFTSCTVTAVAIKIVVLGITIINFVAPLNTVLIGASRRLLTNATLTCSVNRLSNADNPADAVTVTFPSGSSSGSATLSPDATGANWSVVLTGNLLQTGVLMASSGSTETFSFKIVRGSDGKTATTQQTAALTSIGID